MGRLGGHRSEKKIAPHEVDGFTKAIVKEIENDAALKRAPRTVLPEDKEQNERKG